MNFFDKERRKTFLPVSEILANFLCFVIELVTSDSTSFDATLLVSEDDMNNKRSEMYDVRCTKYVIMKKEK